MTARGWMVLALLVVMGAFAVQGGEYSTWDYRTLQRELRTEEATEARLARAVDSLAKVKKAIETDPVEQERIAREKFGMIRPGERLYEFARPDQP